MTQQQLQASAPDTPVENDFLRNSTQCPNCGNLWQQSSMTVNRLAAATAVLAAPATGVLSAAGSAADSIGPFLQSLAYNPSFTSFVADALSGFTPATVAPATEGGLFGLATGWLITDWSEQ